MSKVHFEETSEEESEDEEEDKESEVNGAEQEEDEPSMLEIKVFSQFQAINRTLKLLTVFICFILQFLKGSLLLDTK